MPRVSSKGWRSRSTPAPVSEFVRQPGPEGSSIRERRAEDVVLGDVRLTVHGECTHHAVKNVPLAVTRLHLEAVGLHAFLPDKILGHPHDERDVLLYIGCDGIRHTVQVEAMFP